MSISAASSPQLSPFAEAFARVAELVKQLRTDGHSIARIDLGGGLGVPYVSSNEPPPDPDSYGAARVPSRDGTWRQTDR